MAAKHKVITSVNSDISQKKKHNQKFLLEFFQEIHQRLLEIVRNREILLKID